MTLVSAGNAVCTVIFLIFLAAILASFKHLSFAFRQKILSVSQRILLNIQNLHKRQGKQRAICYHHNAEFEWWTTLMVLFIDGILLDIEGELLQDSTQN